MSIQIKLKQVVRKKGKDKDEFYISIPKAFVDSEMVKVGKKYKVTLDPIPDSDDSEEKCETE